MIVKNKEILLLILGLFTSCQKMIVPIKPVLPRKICVFPKEKIAYEPVLDYSSDIRNKKKASLEVYQYEQREKLIIQCYEDILNPIVTRTNE